MALKFLIVFAIAYIVGDSKYNNSFIAINECLRVLMLLIIFLLYGHNF